MSIEITRRRGDTRRMTFRIGDTNGSPINLIDWNYFYMTVNQEETPDDATNQVAQQPGIVVDAKAGRVAFVADGTIPVGEYYYDIQATDDNGEITTLMYGEYKVVQDITKV